MDLIGVLAVLVAVLIAAAGGDDDVVDCKLVDPQVRSVFARVLQLSRVHYVTCLVKTKAASSNDTKFRRFGLGAHCRRLHANMEYDLWPAPLRANATVQFSDPDPEGERGQSTTWVTLADGWTVFSRAAAEFVPPGVGRGPCKYYPWEGCYQSDNPAVPVTSWYRFPDGGCEEHQHAYDVLLEGPAKLTESQFLMFEKAAEGAAYRLTKKTTVCGDEAYATQYDGVIVVVSEEGSFSLGTGAVPFAPENHNPKTATEAPSTFEEKEVARHVRVDRDLRSLKAGQAELAEMVARVEQAVHALRPKPEKQQGKNERTTFPHTG